MTIYKPKPSESKDDAKKKPLNAAVVVENTARATTPRPVPIATLQLLQARRRRSGLVLMGCVVLLVLLIFLIAAAGTYFLYSHNRPEQHVEKAEVKFYELKGHQRRIEHGSFFEEIEFQDGDDVHERLDVPQILESRRSTVVHDFEKNLTAIVDRDFQRCYIMPLNRTTVKPPRSFLDLMIKYRTGYYLPDAELVRNNYRVQLPPVADVESFGFYIWFDCRYYSTYRLVHDNERLISKRSVASSCDMIGESFCLGFGGTEQMNCVKITGCN